MSLRLDPRRLQALKRLAADAGTRPGDLVRRWVEERIDADRVGEGGLSLEARVTALEERLASLLPVSEAPAGAVPAETRPEPGEIDEDERSEPASAATDEGGTSEPAPEAEADAAPDAETEAETAPEAEAETAPEAGTAPDPPKRRGRVSAAPSARVALHDEMIAVIAERGPMTAGELAAAIAERGRYAPPRSGRPLDAAMVSQRASNPTYRSRFLRREGRIGLADDSR